MANDLVELTTQEEAFIEALLQNGGVATRAAEAVGYSPQYACQLRKRLGKHIIQATQEYFTLNAVNAASRVVKSINDEMPNSTNLNAAIALLDRVGIVKKDITNDGITVKANIFILPAKQSVEAIEVEYTESRD